MKLPAASWKLEGRLRQFMNWGLDVAHEVRCQAAQAPGGCKRPTYEHAYSFLKSEALCILHVQPQADQVKT